MRIAIVGAGVSGLSCAYALHRRFDVTLYEAEPRLGGHSNTVEVLHDGDRIPVDAGFIVYNEQTYRTFTALLAELGVATRASDMSFAVSLGPDGPEYGGRGLRALLGGGGNAFRLDFHRMLIDVARFNREARRALGHGLDPSLALRDFLAARGLSRPFQNHYLLPMAAAIWSGSSEELLDVPASAFLRFFADHGLLSSHDRLVWRTVVGGARAYVARLAAPLGARIRTATPVVRVRRLDAGVEVRDARGGCHVFDHLVLACHADQALAVLDPPSPLERDLLARFAYRANHAVLHQDARLMPRRRAAWASWNYLGSPPESDTSSVSVTYWMNMLQGIRSDCPLFVSLNPLIEPQVDLVLGRFAYAHPQFSHATLEAQERRHEIQGVDRIWFAGAHWGYGFHEDGARSGLEVAAALGAPTSWLAASSMPVASPREESAPAPKLLAETD